MKHPYSHLFAIAGKIIRKFISTLLGLKILLLLSVPALGVEEGDFVYQINGSGAEITDYFGAGGDLFIPNTLGGLPVRAIGDLCFASAENIKSITLPDTLTSIGSSAFSECSKLTSISIPNGVTAILPDTFAYCYSLTNISLPNNLALIGSDAFLECKSLISITLPNAVTNIANYAFEFSGLTSIAIPNSVTYLGGAVFQGCSRLKDVTIGNNVTIVRWDAFAVCGALENVTFPQNLLYIGGSAFYGCTSLTRITIPASVIDINVDGFGECRNLAGVYFEGAPPGYDIEAGIFSGSPFVTIFRLSGVTGWGSTFAGSPTAIWTPRPSYGDWAASIGLSARFPTASGQGDDADGDGVTNGDEWLAGTDPTKSASRLEFEPGARPAELAPMDKTPVPAGQRAVYFRSVPGRYYCVQRTTSLSGTWVVQAVRTASTTQTRFVLPVDGMQGFYRVVAMP